MANDYVEKEFQALIAARYKMKDVARRAQEDWNTYSAPLSQHAIRLTKRCSSWP